MKRQLISLMLLSVLALVGCQRTELEPLSGGKIDSSKQREVTLGAVKLTGDSPEQQAAKATRATSVSNFMPIGSKFRLYAFEKDKTEIQDLLATRTYIIIDDAGTAELEGDQPSLYLPVGEIDIYLVGPTEAVVGSVHPTEHGQLVSIANESGVFPRIGIDLIASKTQITVKDGEANTFDATPLSHKMSLVETRITRPDDAAYTNFELNKVIMSNQAVEGTFAFGENGGKITRSGTRYNITIDEVITATEHKEYYVRSLLMPAEQVQMNIGIYFSCLMAGEQIADKRLNSSVKPYALPAGQKVLFTATPLIASDLVFNCSVSAWDNVNMGELTPTVTDDYLVWYDANDAPVTIDGKRYWLDRSGNGRHAELIGDIKYDPVGKYYYKGTISDNNYIKVPPLGYLAPYTFEMVASGKMTAGNSNVAVYFGYGNRSLLIHLPYSDSRVYYDSGGTSVDKNRMMNSTLINDPRLYENITTWGFVHSGTASTETNTGQIWRNGMMIQERKTMTSDYKSFEENRLLVNGCNDMKLYGVRMTKTALSASQMKINATSDVSRYYGMNKYSPKGNGYPSEPITDGLILDLRGTDGPNTTLVSGKTVWEDHSRSLNHAEIFGNVTYTAPYYQFTASANDYMKLLRSLGTHQEFTVELVALAPNESIFTGNSDPSGGTLINFGPTINDASRSMHIHYVRGEKFIANSPYNQGGRNQLSVGITSFPAPIPKGDVYTKQFHISVVRKPGGSGSKGLVARINGTVIGSVDATTSNVQEMLNCYIGNNGNNQPFGGKLYGIRFYNRVLSEKELQYNYEYDKGAYNILP